MIIAAFKDVKMKNSNIQQNRTLLVYLQDLYSLSKLHTIYNLVM